MDLGDLLVNRLVDKAVPQEPKKYVIQLQVRGPIPVCLNAAGNASIELGQSAAYDVMLLIDVIDAVFDKADWLDISKKMPKDIAESKLHKAQEAGINGRMVCGCGKNFKLRMEEVY
jgi:hypothetical protein